MPTTVLNSRFGAAILLMSVVCSNGCGEPAAESAATAEPMRATPPAEEPAPDDAAVCNNYLEPNAIPFATALFLVSDACPSPRERVAPVASSTTTINVSQDQPGEICMNGQVSTGWANLIVSLDRINDIFGDTPPPVTRQPLNTVALGIAGLRFTLDPAPANGLHVALSQVIADNCTVTQDCIRAGFYMMAEGSPGVLLNFDEAGQQTLRIADFERAPWEDPTRELDTTQISGVEFELNAGEFDFCIRDFALLDASGNAVAPPRE
jgi:hypothetical protein